MSWPQEDLGVPPPSWELPDFFAHRWQARAVGPQAQLPTAPQHRRGTGGQKPLTYKAGQGYPCLIALHGFIKKARRTPVDDLPLARKRQKELNQ